MLEFKIANQFKRPRGILGYFISKMMDKGNAEAVDWVFSLLDSKGNENIMEIGYGSGVLIEKLAKSNSAARIFGIDFSEVMLKRARRRNKKFIRINQVNLVFGNILNYENYGVLFEKIAAINVIYFCDNLGKFFDKLYSLLRASGRVYLFMADLESMDADNKMKFIQTKVFNKYKTGFVKEELEKAYFRNVQVLSKEVNHVKAYCVIAEK